MNRPIFAPMSKITGEGRDNLERISKATASFKLLERECSNRRTHLTLWAKLYFKTDKKISPERQTENSFIYCLTLSRLRTKINNEISKCWFYNKISILLAALDDTNVKGSDRPKDRRPSVRLREWTAYVSVLPLVMSPRHLPNVGNRFPWMPPLYLLIRDLRLH